MRVRKLILGVIVALGTLLGPAPAWADATDDAIADLRATIGKKDFVKAVEQVKARV